MAIASIVLGMGAFLCMIVGFFTTGVPVVGALFSFGGPVLALAGIVTGGVAMSRSKQETGDSSGAAIAGLVVSIVGFFLSLIVALTCGLCNACLTSTTMDANQRAQNGGAGGGSAGGLFGQAIGQALEEAGERMGLSVRLNAIQSECMTDPSGASSSRHFHPATFAAIQGSLCAQMGPQAGQAFSRDCSQQTPCSTRIPMAGTPEAAQAQAAGITDLSTCSVYTTMGSARLGLCSQNGEALLVSITNLNDIQ